jgi:hypothetical protein
MLSDALWDAVAPENRTGPVRVQISQLPEAGGTIGPLPDGSVIEVEQARSHPEHAGVAVPPLSQ